MQESYFEDLYERQAALQGALVKELGASESLARRLAEATHAHEVRFQREVGSRFKTDCRSGCAHCCHQPATVFPFEAIRIAQALKAKLTAEELQDLRRRMESRVKALLGRSVKKSINDKTACPLLQDGNCTIYADRPLTCRMAHSFSVKRCKQAFLKDRFKARIPISLEIQTGVSGILEAVFEGLPKLGRDGGLYELCSAVLVALEDQDAAKRWAAGEGGVFSRAIPDDT